MGKPGEHTQDFSYICKRKAVGSVSNKPTAATCDFSLGVLGQAGADAGFLEMVFRYDWH